MLNTESLGKVTNFKAVPGYGIQCTVSGITEMLKATTRSQVVAQNNLTNGYAPIDGISVNAQPPTSSSLDPSGIGMCLVCSSS